MSFMSTATKLRLKFQLGSVAVDAAQQIWRYLERGGKPFEVPISFNTEDPTMRALFCLQMMHPEVSMGMRQSRSIIVSYHEKGANQNISPEAFDMLVKGGQLGMNQGKWMSNLQNMLAGQESFLNAQGLDPRQMEKEAKTAEMAKHAISVGQQGSDGMASMVLGPDGKPIFTRPIDPTLDEDNVTRLSEARARSGVIPSKVAQPNAQPVAHSGSPEVAESNDTPKAS